MCSTNSQIKFKTRTLKSVLRDYCDEYIFVNGNELVANMEVADADSNNEDKQVIF